MPEDRDPQEVVKHSLCPACEDEIAEARAYVIKAAGLAIVSSIPLVVILSFAEAVLARPARVWVLDEKILGCIVAATAAIVTFAWRTKK